MIVIVAMNGVVHPGRLRCSPVSQNAPSQKLVSMPICEPLRCPPLLASLAAMAVRDRGKSRRAPGARGVAPRRPSPESFIARHGLWSDAQRRQAGELARRLKAENIRLVRVAWADPRGYCRAKAVTVPAFVAALENGYNINVATTTLDAAGTRTFASFTRGGSRASAACRCG
jgi:hypothetical protein